MRSSLRILSGYSIQCFNLSFVDAAVVQRRFCAYHPIISTGQRFKRAVMCALGMGELTNNWISMEGALHHLIIV